MTKSGEVLPLPGLLSGWFAVTDTIVAVGDGSTRSVAETVSVTFTILWSSGQRLFGDAVMLLIAGGVVSCTFTVNEPVDVPAAFVAVQLTVVVPSGKVEPEAGEHENVSAPSAVAVYVTTAPAGLVASAVIGSGRCRIGTPTLMLNEPKA